MENSFVNNQEILGKLKFALFLIDIVNFSFNAVDWRLGTKTILIMKI